MKLILPVVLVFLLSGCAHISWHGVLPSREYTVSFVDDNQYPVKGVSFLCSGEQGTITEMLAIELNSSASISGEDGILILKHGATEISGSYEEFASFQWNNKDVPLPYCEFYYEGVEVFSGVIWLANGKKIKV